MAVMVSMLRGVNLASHNRVKMDVLRALYVSLKLRDPETYIQSGNVVFRTEDRDIVAVTERIQKGIARKCRIRCDVIIRTAAELKSVIRRNPFAGRAGIEPSKLLVWFLAADPGREIRQKVLAIPIAPEELHMHDRELYIYFANGLARPKLSWSALDRTLKTSGTGRNWNSVTKLLEIAERMEGEE
jgi:uncharacterized protein (DUF1697 family)